MAHYVLLILYYVKYFYDFLVLINWLCAVRQNINIMTNISKLKQSLLILALILMLC